MRRFDRNDNAGQRSAGHCACGAEQASTGEMEHVEFLRSFEFEILQALSQAVTFRLRRAAPQDG